MLQWGQAFSNILQWFIDQPFSRDPAGFGSFLASTVLEQYDDAIKLCLYGLKATPGEFILLNNLAFSYLKKGEVKAAQFIINKIHYDSLIEREKAIYNATKGLLMYKSNQIELGDKLYIEAGQQAEKAKDKKLKFLADFYHLVAQLESENFTQEKLNTLDRLENELIDLNEGYLTELIKILRKKIANPPYNK